MIKTTLAAAVASTLTPLRVYQRGLINDLKVEWLKGNQNVLVVSATGSGKTVVFSDVIANEPAPSVAIAHRHELVSQMSMALARNGVRHRIIGSSQLANEARANHLDELGVSYVDPNASAAVASVDTLINMDPNDPWFASVRLWVMDEAHHVLKHNKWGTAVAMFPNARGLGVTAETERADGYGLGRKNDGVFDAIVLAPTMRDLINMGFLTDYKVYAPPSNLDQRALNEAISKTTGDFSQKKNAKITKAAKITGDIVKHYLKLAKGKLGVTFAVDIEHATEIAAEYRKNGVPAEVVSSKTPADRRRAILREFKERKILNLVNVDLFGEGFDLPTIEVVSMGRATMSFNLYKQQFGRALRLMVGAEHQRVWDNYTVEQRKAIIQSSGKPAAIIIDHVGNVFRHGVPDQPRDFTLGKPTPRNQRGPDENVIPMRACVECTQTYERIYKACKHCGHEPEIVERRAPEYVDGDLLELTADVLRKMRGEADAIMSPTPTIPYGASPVVEAAVKRRHYERQLAQHELRESLALWAGWQKSLGRNDSEIYRLFFLAYGTDMLGAQSLGAPDAKELTAKVKARLSANNVVRA